MKLKTYTFKMRGQRHSVHPAVGFRIGPVILFGVWFVKRRHKGLTPRAQRLLERPGGAQLTDPDPMKEAA